MTDASDASRDPRDPQLQRLLEALRRFAPPFSRYSRVSEVGSGAMGVVEQATDQLLERNVALKALRVREGSAAEQEKRLRRFLFEARVTGNLDHPAIVAVHDIGIDDAGTPYFAMKLVRGEPLSQSFERCARGEEAWSLPRLVGVLQRVCEAMSYAHQKGVLHRDLKPSNVMVGRFGEVYVMDWGLARSLDAPDENDIRVSPQEPATEQIDDIDADEELRTADGDIIGTPAYMPPEQAHGRISQMGPHSDIYSVGAMLYHLLAGHMPYVPKFSRVGVHTLFLWVREGPPTDLATLAPAAPPELVAICNKAMAREPSQRFASMDEFADELRRYIEGRVVRSHRTGPIIELRKWARRNRVAAALAVATPLLLMGAGGMTLQAHERRFDEERFRNDVLSARELVATARRLGPLEPARVAAMRDWLHRCDELLVRDGRYAREFMALTTSLESSAQRTSSVDGAERARAISEALEQLIETRTEKLSSEQDPTRRAVALEELRVAQLELSHWEACAEASTPNPLVGERAASHRDTAPRAEQLAELLNNLHRLRWSERKRVAADLELAASLRSRSLEAPQSSWDECLRSISDASECPLYAGMRPIPPQLGLEPLGRNRRTGLWEFWRLDTGERPPLDAEGHWRSNEAGGIVLVLLPGGPFRAGVDGAPEPVRSWNVNLEPFFVSKYELTQAQCIRMFERNPSEHFAGLLPGAAGSSGKQIPILTRAHPVENITWREANDALARFGLELPAEAQWEYAARAGSVGPWGGATEADLSRCANFADLDYAEAQGAANQSTVNTRDGFVLHAPVGAKAPNAFGLFDTLGNVAEWCCDNYVRPAEKRPIAISESSGERSTTWKLHRIYKGGAFKYLPQQCEVTDRFPRDPDARDDYIGVRAVRAVTFETP